MLPNICSPFKLPYKLLIQAVRPSGPLHLHWRGSASLLTGALSTARCPHKRRNPPQIGFKLLGSVIRAAARPSFTRARLHSYQPPTFATMSPQDRDVLPDTVKPINYNIKLFDLELGAGFAFHGAVTIEVDIKAAVGEITLNAHELDVNSATIDGKNVQGMSYRFSLCSSGMPNSVQRETFPMTKSRSGSLWAFHRRLALPKRPCTSSTKES